MKMQNEKSIIEHLEEYCERNKQFNQFGNKGRDWAQGAIVFCFESGLITSEERYRILKEYGLMD